MAHQSGKRTAHEVPSGDLAWAALEAILGPPPATVQPVGSITAKDYAARYGVSQSQANAMLVSAVASGKLQRVEFRPVGGRVTFAYLPVQA
jgi:hypothetical protein